MKLNCINCNTTSGGHKALFGLLREQNVGGTRHIFVVPDRFTLGVEKAICDVLYPDGAFNVDVCSFTRLAQKALGRKNKACLSKEGTVLLLNRIIGENSDKMCYYKNVKSVAFSREMFASLASIRSSKITPDDLAQKAALIQGSVGDKLKDIAVVYRAYEQALEGKYFDTVTRVEWLNNNLQDSDYVKNSHIYLLGFNVYSAAQMEFIRRAVVFCPSVSIAFCDGTGNPNSDCFSLRQREELLTYCQTAGASVSFRTGTEVLSPTMSFLHRQMFGKSNETRKGTDEVRVNAENNSYEEIKAAAREIRHLAIEGGFRYKEIAVVVNNSDLNPTVAKTFTRYGIPFFIDEKYMVRNTFFAVYVFRILACADSGMDRADVISLIRHPYSGFGRTEIQNFENYCLKYNINYTRFTLPLTLGEAEEVEDIRERVATLVASVPKLADIKIYCDIIESWADEGIKAKEREYSCGTTAERVYSDSEKFLNVVREIRTLLSGEITLGEFIAMLSSVLENMTVSVLPQYMDSVFVGNMAESRFNGVRAMFIVGANDGFFPMTTGDKLILGCYDTEVMRGNGLAVFPSPEESNFFERFAAIDLVSKPERLYITYSLTSADGTVPGEGSGVREIKYRLGLTERSFASYYDFTEEDALVYRFATPENCLYEYISGGVDDEYSDSVRDFLAEEGLLEKVGVEPGGVNLPDGYPRTKKGDYRLSVSKMETYFKCPFKNYLTNVLGLKEREEGELRVNDKGIIIHAVLERYFSSGEKLRKMTEKERAAFAVKCIESELSLPEYDRYKDNFVAAKELDGIKSECVRVLKVLTDNMLHSRFTPVMTEKRFGDGEELVIESGGKKFVFYGFVDRVDACDNEIAIIDYKTGRVEEDLSEVFTGVKIQLYLYLKYFLDKGYKASGVFYLPIADGYRDKPSSYAMQGQMKGDIETYQKFDMRAKEPLSEKYSSPNVAFSIKMKDGKPIFSDNVKNLIEEKSFYEISSYVMKLCEKAVAEIADGEMSKKPHVDGCKFCPYEKICGEVPEREVVKADALSFSYCMERAEGTDELE